MSDAQVKIRQRAIIREWVESIIIAFLLAMFIRTFFIQAFKIPSGSMRMTLVEGDRILVNKTVYGAKIPFLKKRLPGFRRPQRGDVIVFIYPGDPKKDYIKRLIGLSGETVEINKGRIYIYGRSEVINSGNLIGIHLSINVEGAVGKLAL